MVSNPVEITIKIQILLPNHPKVLLSPEGKNHPLIQNSSLRLVAWLVSEADLGLLQHPRWSALR